jgi:hypothetical protein
MLHPIRALVTETKQTTGTILIIVTRCSSVGVQQETSMKHALLVFLFLLGLLFITEDAGSRFL